MIILLSGSKKEDYKNSAISEHYEASLYVERLKTLLPEINSDITGTVREKINQCNKSDASLVIEIQFNTNNKDNKNGLKILYQNHDDVSSYIAYLFAEDFKKVGYDVNPSVGWYRGIENNGLDFLLENSLAPTVIIQPDHIDNADIADRVLICDVLAKILCGFID